MARKISGGPIRNTEKTKAKIIAAVGKVLCKYGYEGLRSSYIAKEAKVDAKLLVYYFGDLNNLINTYIRSKEYLNNFPQDIIQKVNALEGLRPDALEAVMEHQFESLLSSIETQKFVHWQLGEANDALRQIAGGREAMAVELFKKADKVFDGTDVDFGAMYAIMVGSMYSTLLHTFNGIGGALYGLDLKLPADRGRIKKEIARLIKLSYEDAKKQRKKSIK
ncbi:MAG TPA: TetR/AcrR family transcriptional regulator [Arachidicoccus sp.]